MVKISERLFMFVSFFCSALLPAGRFELLPFPVQLRVKPFFIYHTFYGILRLRGVIFLNAGQ
jgi:hypothetical protein